MRRLAGCATAAGIRALTTCTSSQGGPFLVAGGSSETSSRSPGRVVSDCTGFRPVIGQLAEATFAEPDPDPLLTPLRPARKQ